MEGLGLVGHGALNPGLQSRYLLGKITFRDRAEQHPDRAAVAEPPQVPGACSPPSPRQDAKDKARLTRSRPLNRRIVSRPFVRIITGTEIMPIFPGPRNDLGGNRRNAPCSITEMPNLRDQVRETTRRLHDDIMVEERLTVGTRLQEAAIRRNSGLPSGPPAADVPSWPAARPGLTRQATDGPAARSGDPRPVPPPLTAPTGTSSPGPRISPNVGSITKSHRHCNDQTAPLLCGKATGAGRVEMMPDAEGTSAHRPRTGLSEYG